MEKKKYWGAETEGDKRREHSTRIGIKWKMIAILVIFITIVAAVIWFFQIRMLQPFYQDTKLNEMRFSEERFLGALPDGEAVEEIVYACADEFHNDILIFSVQRDQAIPIAKANGSGNTETPFLLHHFPAMYDAAAQNGGSYMAVLHRGTVLGEQKDTVIADNAGHPESVPFTTYYSGSLYAIGITVCEVDGEEYAMMQISDLTPVSSLVKTLRSQFVWIGIIFVAIVLLLSEVLSRFITKPFVQMNRAAKELARGNYDVCFSGHGYREIKELADTLNYAASELSHSDALQKELISNVSHDLRTPLTMIKGYSEVMRDIPGENTPENVQVIIDETERLTDLVNDMLDLSRIQAGMQKPNFEAFSLTETVRSTMTRYEKLTRQEGYRIAFEADCDVMVYADRGMILQVVYNLINNAIHYTGEDKCVSVSQIATEDSVRIVVTDTGDGIEADQIPNIWDRYYRVDRVHKRAAVGTGLGLSIVKGILEMHHAVYGVNSTPKHGSTFWFELKRVSDIQEKIEEVKETV